jgi:glycosyltransferase involved in cell wall biosynthesis
VALWMAAAFPGATVFTSVYLPEQTFADFKKLDVRTLPLAKFIKTEKQFKLLYPLWLAELREMKFSEFDLVLSSSTYLAKFIRPAAHVKHRSYLHAPFRLLWKPESYSADSLPTPASMNGLIRLSLPSLRRFDIRATQRIDAIATNCKNIATEIAAIYQRQAEVIHPPVVLNDYAISKKPGDYFLSVSRLISHKRVDLAI